MPDSTTWLVFFIATLTLNLTPGPDLLYIVGRSTGQGTAAGVVSALGIGVGIAVHTVAAAFGLSALLLSSALAFEMVKWAGAIYLVFLGLRTIFGNRREATPAALRPADRLTIFRQGIIVDVLNPKVALFFLAFLPQFVDPARGSATGQFLLFGALVNLSGTLVNTTVALLAGRIAARLSGRPGLARWQQRITGGVFIGLGARLALFERR